MTTIAYRNGILASDALVTSGNARAGKVKKIAKGNGVMGGMSGSAEACQSFIEWIEAGAEGACPGLDGTDADGILIKGRKTFYVGPKGVPVPFKAKFAAVGSGEKFALGAMAMGADAATAVKVASKLDVNSGGSVRTLKLKA